MCPSHNFHPWPTIPFSNATQKQAFQILKSSPVSPAKSSLQPAKFLDLFPAPHKSCFPDCLSFAKCPPGFHFPPKLWHQAELSIPGVAYPARPTEAISCLTLSIVLLLMHLWIPLVAFWQPHPNVDSDSACGQLKPTTLGHVSLRRVLFHPLLLQVCVCVCVHICTLT